MKRAWALLWLVSTGCSAASTPADVEWVDESSFTMAKSDLFLGVPLGPTPVDELRVRAALDQNCPLQLVELSASSTGLDVVLDVCGVERRYRFDPSSGADALEVIATVAATAAVHEALDAATPPASPASSDDSSRGAPTPRPHEKGR